MPAKSKKAKRSSVKSAQKHQRTQEEFYANPEDACKNLKNHPKHGNKKYESCLAHAKKVNKETIGQKTRRMNKESLASTKKRMEKKSLSKGY